MISAQSVDIQAVIDQFLSSDLFLIVAGAIGAYGLLMLLAVIIGISKSVKNRKTAKARVMLMREQKDVQVDEFEQPVSKIEDVEESAVENQSEEEVVEEADEIIEDVEETIEEDSTYNDEIIEESEDEIVEEETEEVVEDVEETIEEDSTYNDEIIEESEDEIVEEETEEVSEDVEETIEEDSTYNDEIVEESEDEIVEEEIKAVPSDVIQLEAEEEVVEEPVEEEITKDEPIIEEVVAPAIEEPITEETSDDTIEYVTYEETEEEIAQSSEPVVETVEEKEEVKAEEPVVEVKKKRNAKNSPTALSAQLKKAKKAKVEKEVETVEEQKTETEEPKIEEKTVKTEIEETAVEEEKKNTRYVGKWKIKEIGEGEFSSFLYASNGQLLLTSEVYASADGARSGIATISKNVALEKFEIHSDKNGRYFYKVKSSANRLLCVGETYNTKIACLKSVASVKKFCANAIILDVIEKDITIIKYVPHDEIEVKPGYDGKWIIEGFDEFYMAKLFASNGELLLVGESFKLYDSAKANIETIRKNALASNFIIDKDKKGKFYYKLRNAQKSILCVGESYDTLAGAERAIESVKRFAKTAKLVETAPTVEE